MKKLLLSLFICLSCVTFTFAQEESENFNLPKNALGFFAKNVNNNNGPVLFGINYQRWLNDYIGLQGTIANEYVNTFQENGEEIFFNADLELQVKIIEHKFKSIDLATTLYAWASAGIYSENYFGSEYIQSSEVWKDIKLKNTYFLTGIGFGFDMTLYEHVSIPFSFGYIASFSDEFLADFTVSVGYRYRF